MQKYTVDSVTEGLARLLPWESGQELVVPLAELPGGAGEGDILFIQLANGKIASARIDHQETRAQRKKVEALLDKLKAKNRPR